jgi:hypothetical protein
MGRVLAVSVLVLLAGACADKGSGGPGSVEPSGQTGPDLTRVEIYTAAFRSLAATERWFDPVLLDDRICPDIGDVRANPGPCGERFTKAEQVAILAGLAAFPRTRFVDDAERIQDRIFAGGLEGAGLLSVGVIGGDDERVTVGGRSYCGGLCAHWMTLVLRNGPEGWTVTGTTGPVAIA